jgi:hypothetical protein
VAYGVWRGVAPLSSDASGSSGTSTRAFDQRIDSILDRLDSVEKTLADRETVSHYDLEEALRRASSKIMTEVDKRFEVQRVSVTALQTLVAQTDQLLERVLTQLENASADKPERSGRPAARLDTSGGDLDAPLSRVTA